jgi:predicted nucleotidyltransferase
MSHSPIPPAAVIPGISLAASETLLRTLQSCPRVEEVWLYGSRAMGRQRPGSDIDITLVGHQLSHGDRLGLMEAIDELMLPWGVDLSLLAELPADLQAHVTRVARRLL